MVPCVYTWRRALAAGSNATPPHSWHTCVFQMSRATLRHVFGAHSLSFVSLRCRAVALGRPRNCPVVFLNHSPPPQIQNYPRSSVFGVCIVLAGCCSDQMSMYSCCSRCQTHKHVRGCHSSASISLGAVAACPWANTRSDVVSFRKAALCLRGASKDVDAKLHAKLYHDVPFNETTFQFGGTRNQHTQDSGCVSCVVEVGHTYKQGGVRLSLAENLGLCGCPGPWHPPPGGVIAAPGYMSQTELVLIRKLAPADSNDKKCLNRVPRQSLESYYDLSPSV
eukprot:gene24942-biopygen2957